jgi:hypothetical protein
MARAVQGDWRATVGRSAELKGKRRIHHTTRKTELRQVGQVELLALYRRDMLHAKGQGKGGTRDQFDATAAGACEHKRCGLINGALQQPSLTCMSAARPIWCSPPSGQSTGPPTAMKWSNSG